MMTASSVLTEKLPSSPPHRFVAPSYEQIPGQQQRLGPKVSPDKIIQWGMRGEHSVTMATRNKHFLIHVVNPVVLSHRALYSAIASEQHKSSHPQLLLLIIN